MLTTHLHLAPRLNEWNCTSSSPTRLHGVDSYNFTFIILIYFHHRRSQWPCGLRRRSAAAGLLRLWVWIPLGAWMFVCCEYCVLSSRGFCDELISRPEESCVLETSCMRRPWPTGGCCTKNKKLAPPTTAPPPTTASAAATTTITTIPCVTSAKSSCIPFVAIIFTVWFREQVARPLHSEIFFWRRVVTVWYSLADRK